jgi:hypothetical protein
LQTESTLNAKYDAHITSIDAGTVIHAKPVPQNAIPKHISNEIDSNEKQSWNDLPRMLSTDDGIFFQIRCLEDRSGLTRPQ